MIKEFVPEMRSDKKDAEIARLREALRMDAERCAELDKANTSLADENCRMRLALMELIDAVNACDEDSENFTEQLKRFDIAMASAMQFHEDTLMKNAQMEFPEAIRAEAEKEGK